MLLSFSEGFLLGLGAAVPLGPINILIMNEAIKRYKSAVAIGLGAMSADLLYLVLISLGLMAFVKEGVFLDALSLFSSLFLIYLSYMIFKNKDKNPSKTTETTKNKKLKIQYVKGFILTLLNPYTVGFWLSVSGYVATKDLDFRTTIFGMLSAILLWVILMPLFVHKTRHKISQKVSKWFSIVSALILAVFGIMTLTNLLN
jgi:L-lysine exporter family protein LysE/ArgO